jgi:hypothetical protein
MGRRHPDANFKADIATYSHVDPLATITNLEAIDVPVSGRPLRAAGRPRAAAACSSSAAHARRLWAVCETAESAATDGARLTAYAQLRDMIRWLPSTTPTTRATDAAIVEQVTLGGNGHLGDALERERRARGQFGPSRSTATMTHGEDGG